MLGRGGECSDFSISLQVTAGDLAEECRFFLDTQLMFLKKAKEPTSRIFDDDTWIQSLTQAEATTRHPSFTWRGSLQNLQKIVRKARSVHGSQLLGVRDQWMLLAQRTWAR